MKDQRRSFLLPPPEETLPAALGFLRQARFRLAEDYMVKIARSVELLDDARVWARPNEASNSIGNLILHLAGNLRQWVVAGVGGALDVRVRDLEFAAREVMTRDELLALLSGTVEEATGVLEGLEAEIRAAESDAPLARLVEPQGYSQTILDAVFHAVEHFSYHTGQIVLLAKWHAGASVRFYDDGELAEKG